MTRKQRRALLFSVLPFGIEGEYIPEHWDDDDYIDEDEGEDDLCPTM